MNGILRISTEETEESWRQADLLKGSTREPLNIIYFCHIINSSCSYLTHNYYASEHSTHPEDSIYIQCPPVNTFNGDIVDGKSMVIRPQEQWAHVLAESNH